MGFAIVVEIDYALDHRDIQLLLTKAKQNLRSRKKELNVIPLDTVAEIRTDDGLTISVQRFKNYK
jgi:hypothetical protein